MAQTPRELFSRVLRPVKTEPDAPPPAPPIPDVSETITRSEFHPDGTVTVYRFTAGEGEETTTYTAEEARKLRDHENPAAATAARIEARLQGAR